MVQNGTYPTKRRGTVTRFKCRTCGHEWKEYEKPTDYFDGVQFRDGSDEALKSFALVAIGLPLDQVEGLVSHKAETITAQLLRCFRRPDLWAKITDRLVTAHGVWPKETSELSSLLERVRKGEANFHAPHRRESGAKIKSRGPKLTKRKIAEAEAMAAQYERDTKDSKSAEGKLPSQSINRGLLGQARVGVYPTKQVERYRSKLKARIEKVLDCEVVVTPSGNFYRVLDDARVGRWLKTVQDFDVVKGERVLAQLSEIERVVFGQVRQPNRLARSYSYLEGAMLRKPTSVYTEKMTPNCLAQGLGMDLGLFIDFLMAVGQHLRKER